MVVQGAQAIVLEWTFFCLAGAFVCLRIHTRWSRLHSITKSDWIILVAYLTFCLTVVIDSMSSAQGFFGKDVTYNSDLSQVLHDPNELRKLLKLLFISAFPYLVTLYLVKVTFILLYYALIPKTLPKLRILLHITTAILICGFIVSMALNLFWCLPIQRNWSTFSKINNKINNNSQCLAYASIIPYFVSTGFHIVLDILIFIIPFPLLKSLQLGRREYYGVVGIFAAGGLCILATVARTAAIGLEASTAQVGIWTSLEQSTALIVASMPALKAFVVARSRNGSSMRQYGHGSSVRQRSNGVVKSHLALSLETGGGGGGGGGGIGGSGVDTERTSRGVGMEGGGSWIRLESPSSTRSEELHGDGKQLKEADEVVIVEPIKSIQTTREDPQLEMAIQKYKLAQQTSQPIQLKIQRGSGNKFSAVRT